MTPPSDRGMPVSGSASAAAAGASPEKSASASVSPRAQPGTAPVQKKLRSCVTCRTRKVRCDKTSPCSNCRRANIPCVVPSTEKLPRWARRLERATTVVDGGDPAAGQVQNRLRKLEGLVKELSGQLGKVQAAGVSPAPPVQRAPKEEQPAVPVDSSASLSSTQSQFGRLVIKGSGQSRYVGSGFWSRINDEVCFPAQRCCNFFTLLIGT
jgi:hypothetical protein